MILCFDEKENKFIYLSENKKKDAPYITLEDAAKRLGITKQGVTRLYGRKLSMVKSIDGKRAISIDEIEKVKQ